MSEERAPYDAGGDQPAVIGPTVPLPGAIIRKVRMAEELTEQLFTRDADGNRLRIEWGEPDAEGFYCPIISVDRTDNPLAASKEALADLLAIAQGVREGWLSERTCAELAQAWKAMADLIDYVDHGTSPASWIAYKRHRERAVQGEAKG